MVDLAYWPMVLAIMLLAGALLVGCAEPDYFEAAGMRVYCESNCPGANETEILLHEWIPDFAYRAGMDWRKAESSLGHLEVHWLDRTYQWLAGYIQGPRIELLATDCAWDSALTHELTHWLLRLQRLDVDCAHEMADAWDASEAARHGAVIARGYCNE